MEKNIIEEFKPDLLSLCNLSCPKNILDKLESYKNYLIQENNKYNLTSICQPKDIYYKHFLDSLTIIKAIKIKNNVIDVGTGAGFPGIVLKIFFPDIKLNLIDSNNKKIFFLQNLISLLNLSNCQIQHCRFENAKIIKDNIIIFRAVANLSKLSQIVQNSLNTDSTYVLMLGKEINQRDLLEFKNKTKLNIIKNISFDLPKNYGKRNIVVLK